MVMFPARWRNTRLTTVFICVRVLLLSHFLQQHEQNRYRYLVPQNFNIYWSHLVA